MTPRMPKRASVATDTTDRSPFRQFCQFGGGPVSPFGDPIHAYSRAQALADGVLVDVSREASPAGMSGGFAVPVAIPGALWSTIESIPPRLAGSADSRGRLHDVLWLAALAARRHRDGDSVPFLVHLPSRGTRKRTVRLVVAIGPGDDGEPVVTIGYPDDF